MNILLLCILRSKLDSRWRATLAVDPTVIIIYTMNINNSYLRFIVGVSSTMETQCGASAKRSMLETHGIIHNSLVYYDALAIIAILVFVLEPTSSTL